MKSKKLIAFLIILAVIGCQSLWAVDAGYATLGITTIGGGLGLIALGATSDYAATDTKILCYTIGGLFTGLGLFLFIGAFLVDDQYYAMAENNAFIKHLSISAWKNQVFIGANFNF